MKKQVKKRLLARVALALAGASALSGCVRDFEALTPPAPAQRVFERKLEQAKFVAPSIPAAPEADEMVALEKNQTLPKKYTEANYSFYSARNLTLREVAGLVMQQTGLSISFRGSERQGATTPPGAADIVKPTATVAQGPQPEGFDPQKALAAANASMGAGTVGQIQPTPGTMAIKYTGRLKGFLNLMADSFGYSWANEDGKVVFSRTEVATFDVPALPVVMKLAFSLDSASQISGGGSGSGQSGGSAQKASTEAAFNLWSEIEKTIQSIVGSEGTVDISGATGTITVNAPAPVVRQAREYIRSINRRLSLQVVLAVDVYSVTLSNGENYGLSGRLQGSVGGVGAGVGSPASALTSTVSDLLATASGSALGMAVIDTGSTFAGSNALVQALSSKGRVSVVTSASLTTLNGIPAPFQVVNTRNYVASVSTTSNTGSTSGSSQTTLTPGSVTTGFNLYVVPRVDNRGTVTLQYGVNISELVGSQDGFDVFSSGGQSVQLPNVNSRNFVQQASVPAGGTLVLSGFEQKSNSDSTRGPGGIWLLGGKRLSASSRTIIVVSITPRIVSFAKSGSAMAAK